VKRFAIYSLCKRTGMLTVPACAAPDEAKIVEGFAPGGANLAFQRGLSIQVRVLTGSATGQSGWLTAEDLKLPTTAPKPAKPVVTLPSTERKQ
jgi:hypothetical protein